MNISFYLGSQYQYNSAVVGKRKLPVNTSMVIIYIEQVAFKVMRKVPMWPVEVNLNKCLECFYSSCLFFVNRSISLIK